ncbi:MAG TPA: hypothetical protein PKC18_08120 [Lacipirellulaceae bacterium]|nr:hypothetical protein [Lacipirellulaceae bacterium]HMP07382.1 hypothetical protein [Lacipirellulaceae bacterium]
MKNLFAGLALASLAGTIAPSILFLAGRLELETVKSAMLAATISWFVFAALWIYGPARARVE